MGDNTVGWRSVRIALLRGVQPVWVDDIRAHSERWLVRSLVHHPTDQLEQIFKPVSRVYCVLRLNQSLDVKIQGQTQDMEQGTARSKSEYYSYLRSPEWQETRKRFWRSKLPKLCYVCGCDDVPLDLHHRSYKTLGCESLTHLVLVCRSCHNEIHRLQKKQQVNLWAATKKVRKLFMRRM